jgi:nicotinamidase-related amidase
MWEKLFAGTGGTPSDLEKMKRRMGFGAHAAILVIDMSCAFVDPSFSLAPAVRPRETIDAIAALISAGRKAGIPVLFTTTRTPRNMADWGRWKWTTLVTNPELSHSDTWQIVEELVPRPEESVVYKTRPSGFFGTDLASLLIHQGIDTVIVTGMTTSGCVRATVVDAFSYNFRVIVPVECVADKVDLSHRVSLFDIHMKFGDVIPLKEVLRYVRSIGGKDHG